MMKSESYPLFGGSASSDRPSRASDWVWDGKDDVDEETYSFLIEEYRPGSLNIEEPTPTRFEVESVKTSHLRQESETQNAAILHFTDQLNQLKSKRQSLLQELSYGLNGDFKRTLAHVAAIHRACADIGVVDGCISDHSNHAKAKCLDYLRSRNEDVEQVLINRECQGFSKPAGFATGLPGVRVRVRTFVPPKNPYPWHG
jgi:hypothetical protein